ncbi:gas vesicle protein K [Pseudorhodobacter sp. MZDSW-24AT]|uniref:gas vesicle protein K n=1 Tax=Pseudorhodobacter sp. MZDSW-24AT TaxID=2052957 RepID=UPI000C1E8018|nr:gas vesicle protein K [Pseudorhodobacter sp. MZDSW-24AT]PJF08889.1 gas vesicle protein K [Pseudorhodobacter sp. MZDSW-24AT]
MTDALSLNPDHVRSLLSKVVPPDGRLRLNPNSAEQDLAKLVLGVVAFLRQLMELQAIRQMEAGLLTPEQEEAVGTTLMRSEAALHQIAAAFGLAPGDLALDLGPLGRTI